MLNCAKCGLDVHWVSGLGITRLRGQGVKDIKSLIPFETEDEIRKNVAVFRDKLISKRQEQLAKEARKAKRRWRKKQE